LRILTISFALLVFSVNNLYAEKVSINGQVSGWVSYKDKAVDKFRTGLRYIPELMAVKPLSEGDELAASVAVNTYTTAPLNSLEDADDNTELELYRMWLRYTTAQAETRAGLQKINFGPAKILRSLKWFDQLDPQDPLALTDGVYALLMRHYFLDNSNLWLWGVKGDDDLKGLEAYGTDENKEEFGGRYQFTLPKGEMAFSYNRRYIDESDWNAKNIDPLKDGVENRYAVDGVWDIGIGVWFEASAESIKIDSGNEVWRDFLTIGADYTLESGVYLLYEHFLKAEGSKIDRTKEKKEFSALSISYSINMIDSVKGIFYYDWNNEKEYYYIDLQRTYDNWQINLSAFRNEENADSAFGGNGIQCMLTYNH
jgi:hypothetical protein